MPLESKEVQALWIKVGDHMGRRGFGALTTNKVLAKTWSEKPVPMVFAELAAEDLGVKLPPTISDETRVKFWEAVDEGVKATWKKATAEKHTSNIVQNFEALGKAERQALIAMLMEKEGTPEDILA